MVAAQEATAPDLLEPDEFIQDALRLASEEQLPIEMGRIVWRADGRLERRGDGEALSFKFVYRGVRFDGRLDMTATGKMAITADLGPLPYTAESAGARHQILRMVRGAVSRQDLHLVVSHQQELRIAAEGVAPRPRTPVCCLATLCTLVLRLRPWLDAIGLAFEESGRAASIRSA